MPIADVSLSPNGIDSNGYYVNWWSPCVVGWWWMAMYDSGWQLMVADGNRTIYNEKIVDDGLHGLRD